MGHSRIPETIPEFNGYVNDSDDYLQAISSGVIHNWERLGISSVKAGEWHTRRQAWNILYPKYTNSLTSTSAIKAQVRNFMSDFRDFANPQLNIMVASPEATSDDEAVFNFKIERAAPSHSTTPIADSVMFDAKHLGGGDLQFTCRTSHDEHRASKAEGADSVQLAYQIADDKTDTSGGAGGSGDTGDKGLPNPDEMTHEIFTKSSFTKHMGAVNAGKGLIVYARWYNTKHPELAGPWSDVRVVIIA